MRRREFITLLGQVLEQVNKEVRDTVWTGWSMFYPFSREEIAPTFHPEHPDGTSSDVLEANLMGDEDDFDKIAGAFALGTTIITAVGWLVSLFAGKIVAWIITLFR